MGKKLTDEFLKWTLDVDGKPAMAALNGMEQKTRLLEKANQGLYNEMAKLEAQGKKNSEEYKQLDKQYKSNNQTIKQSETRMSELRKEIGLNGLTANQLSKRMNELKRAVKDATPDSAAWKQLKKELAEVTARYNQVSGAAVKTNSIFGQLKGLLPAMGVAAIAAGLRSLVSNIIEVRKEFEKYEAVLTNTLGSNKAARSEMQMLQQFASETPFALTELTGSFVKLTNYGLKPTREEMRKYGDLASSVGKGFDQLTEGIADAVTGEFERLKEFGIKAKKEGDKLTFTFKEQKTVVDNNAAAIKNYIQGLGDLQGVTGSMAAISATLGGKISNMGDAWDNLMNSMGAGSSGIMVSVITWTTNMINNFTLALKSIRQIKDEVMDKAVVSGMNNALMEIDIMTKSLVKNGVSQAEAQERAVKLYNESIDKTVLDTMTKVTQATGQEKVNLNQRLTLLTDEKAAVARHYKDLDKIKKQQDEAKNKKPTEKEENSAERKALEALDARNKKQIDIINKDHLAGKTSDAQYKADLLAQEFSFLEKKKAIYKKGSKEYEDAVAAYSDLQIKTSEQVKTLLLQAEKELKNAKITNLKDGIEKEKATEVLRWSEELEGLKKQLIVKKGLTAEEVILNETIYEIIEEQTAAHNRKMKILNSADDIERLEKQRDKLNKINSSADGYSTSTPWMSANQIKPFFDARRVALEEAYKIEQELAGDDQKKQKAAAELYNEEITKLKQQEVDITYDTALQRIDIAQNFLGALSGIVDQESALGKALFLFQQGLAIASIWISTAKANAAAMASLVLPPLWGPVVAANTIYAGVQTALVVAQSVAKFAGGGKKGKGKQAGGYADSSSSDSDPVGVYHANEFIASAPAVRNPKVKPILDIIDIAQRTGTIKSLDLAGAISGGRQAGGYANSSASPSGSTTVIGSDPEMKALLIKLARRLDRPLKASVNKYGANGLSDAMDDISSFKSKVLK